MTSDSAFDLVIIGAGPAGLSAAIAAEREGMDVVLLEAQDAPGGLTRSFAQDGYTFDCSGHLLHLRDPEALRLVEDSTPPEAWNRVTRNSVIYLDGSIVPYPFQLHLAYAPERVRRECLEGLPTETPPAATEFANFGAWIDANLGRGIGRHFMVPYNEKLSTVSVDELTTEWLGRFVPQPSVEEIRAGAETKRTVETGYNRSFLYPARGGIATLSSGLAKQVTNLVTEAKVVEIDTGGRRVLTEGGRSFGYETGVIATLPLPLLAGMVSPGDPALDAASQLRANTVTCVNLGLKRANPEVSQYQWIYLPERDFAAYRVGFYGRFASTMAPPGRESVYVEIAHGPDRSKEEMVAAAIEDLKALGAIEGEDDIDTVLPVRIDCAYVIHDHVTAEIRATLHRELEKRGVWTAGRYASWEYSAMEDAIVSGLRTTQQVLQTTPTGHVA
jgi:protoporphyrinogen oxidase